MSINSKMTALADEIRELSGTTTNKSIEAMTSDVNAANTEITEQIDLISQIANALEGKASGGGVTLPSLSNPASASDILSGKEAINSSGNKMTGTIATKTSSDLTASGATVTVPAGYYASNATKSVSTATQATPSVSIDSAGKITASATQTAGYVSAGTKTGTKQLTTQAAKTITPSTSSQTAVAKDVYTTGAVTVDPIPSNYEDVGTETNAYTTKLASLETAITALENELEGKASGGSGGASVETCTVYFFSGAERSHNAYGVYYENGEFSSYSMPIPDMSNIDVEVIKNSFIVISSTLVTAIDIGSSDVTPISLDRTTISGASIIAVENYESIRINIME